MSDYCKLCDKSIKDKSKCNLLKSITHKLLDESIIRRCIIRNPNLNQVDEIMKNYINTYYKIVDDIGLIVYSNY